MLCCVVSRRTLLTLLLSSSRCLFFALLFLSVSLSLAFGTVITANKAIDTAGAIWVSEPTTVFVCHHCTFTANVVPESKAAARGGALYVRDTTAVLITHTTFTGNRGPQGAAVFISDPLPLAAVNYAEFANLHSSDVTLRHCHFEGGRASNAGALFASGSTVRLQHTHFNDNHAVRPLFACLFGLPVLVFPVSHCSGQQRSLAVALFVRTAEQSWCWRLVGCRTTALRLVAPALPWVLQSSRTSQIAPAIRLAACFLCIVVCDWSTSVCLSWLVGSTRRVYIRAE